MSELGDQLRSEANIAARPGQYDRLLAAAAHADALQAMVDQCRELAIEATENEGGLVVDDLVAIVGYPEGYRRPGGS